MRVDSSNGFDVAVRVKAATSLGSMSLKFQYPPYAAAFVGVCGPEDMVSAANNGVVTLGGDVRQ